MALVTLSLARDYWTERGSFTPAQLAAARQRRLSEIVAEREAEQLSEETLAYLKHRPHANAKLPRSSSESKHAFAAFFRNRT
jgi:hypothetical protein